MSLALAALAAALAAPSPPAAAERPTAAVPIVVGGYGITRGRLRHWADVVQRDGSGGPRSSAREQAAGFLIVGRWIRGEAAERGIALTSAEVGASLAEQRRTAFTTVRAYRRYLRATGQTEGNVRYRAEVDLLSTRVREQVVAGTADALEQQARLDAFVQAFRVKWRARTACRAPWVSASDCQPTARSRGEATPAARTQFLPSAFAR